MTNRESKKQQRDISQQRNQRRKRILKIVLLLVALLAVLLILFSLTDIQRALFPYWLIDLWPQIVAALVVVMIASVIVLPIVIEANLNPRTLSGPGKTPLGAGVDKVVDD